MNTPAVEYVSLAFAGFLVLMSLWGCYTIQRKTGDKWGFWFIFGLAWVAIGISHVLAIAGSNPGAWYILFFRIIGYVTLIISVLSLMIRVVERE